MCTPLVAVDHLRDTEVSGKRAHHIRLVARQLCALADVAHHLARRLLGRVIEVLVQADRDEVRLGLGKWPLQVHVAPHGETELAGHAGLKRGDADLAVALDAVPVAGEEQRTLVEHRQVQRRAGAQLLVVHVAAEAARHRRAAAAPRRRGSGRDDAEERIERNLRPPWHHAEVPFVVHLGVDGLILGELFGQRAEQRQNGDEPPILADADIQDIDLQHVARLGAFDEDGTGYEMGSGALLQRVERRLVAIGDDEPVRWQAFLAAGRERMQRHDVARRHREHRRCRAVEITPDHRLGHRGDFVTFRHVVTPKPCDEIGSRICHLRRNAK